MTVGYLTAGATLVLKTGIGCAVGLLAALICGGAEAIVGLYSRGELPHAVLKGVPWPCLEKYAKGDAAQANGKAREPMLAVGGATIQHEGRAQPRDQV